MRALSLLVCALLLPPLAACGDDESGDPDDDGCDCGDLDGDGTDTGNLPDVVGSWSSMFASQVYFDGCDVADLTQTSESWINGASLTIGGYVPDGLFASFDDDGEEFRGALNSQGGIIFSGRHQHSAGTMQVSFGGQVFTDVWREPARDVIQGFAYLGLDTTGDGNIDCDVRGNWTAIKSGG